MCIPNLALYAGTLVVQRPDSEAEEEEMTISAENVTTTAPLKRQVDIDMEDSPTTRATVSILDFSKIKYNGIEIVQ